MKIVVKKETFSGAIARFQSILERKSTRPVLENILLIAQAEKITMMATDLRISLTLEEPCVVEVPGDVGVPGRKLYQIIKELPTDEVTIELKDSNWVTISSGSSTFTIPGIDAAEYPTVASPPEDFVEVNTSMIRSMVERTLFASSNDESRIYLCGVFVKEVEKEGKKYLRMVSTDGHRLSLCDNALDSSAETFADGAIVPKKGLMELKNLLVSGAEKFGIASGENRLFAKVGSMVLDVVLIEASFPNYEQVIPDASQRIITVGRNGFLDALKRVSILSDEDTHSVVVEADDTQMVLSADNPNAGEAKETLPCGYDGDPIKIAFNSVYLMDVLKVVEKNDILIEIQDALSPCIIREKGNEEGFLAVIMPMRLD